jgi:hypothetical protein
VSGAASSTRRGTTEVRWSRSQKSVRSCESGDESVPSARSQQRRRGFSQSQRSGPLVWSAPKNSVDSSAMTPTPMATGNHALIQYLSPWRAGRSFLFQASTACTNHSFLSRTPPQRANPAPPEQIAACRSWDSQSPQCAGGASTRPSTPNCPCRSRNRPGRSSHCRSLCHRRSLIPRRWLWACPPANCLGK